MRLLDLTKFKVTDDGDLDESAIASAIDELVKNKPYLAAGAKPNTGSGDQRPRGNTTQTSVTRDQLKSMTADEIKALPRSVVHAALTAK